MRLFVAVSLNETVRDAMEAAIAEFPVTDPPWRWVERDNWHVTLRFIPDAPHVAAVPHVSDIVSALESVARGHSSFAIVLDSLGAFPSLRRPKVLFYNVSEGADHLAALAVDIDNALVEIGFPAEEKPFHAHATTARIKRPLPRGITRKFERAPGLSGAGQLVESIELMQSHLGRSGARYEVLKQFALPREG
jgi:2'-5' RNA ligase